MKNVLVLTRDPGFAEAVRAALQPETCRILACESPQQAASLASQGIVDGCVIDAEPSGAESLRLIGQCPWLKPAFPAIVYTGARQWEWEEKAYLLGVSHVLDKPVRGQALRSLLERSWGESGNLQADLPPRAGAGGQPAVISESPHLHTLEILRAFSGILSMTLCADALLKQFLGLLRQTLGVNRAAIFVRQWSFPNEKQAGEPASPCLQPSCAMGYEPQLLKYFELTLEAGIGAYVYRSGRILKQDSEEALQNPDIRKEFAILGAHAAVPMLDRESLLGVAVFDRHVTGEPLANAELALIFHLLEELGLALKSSWLHDQLTKSREVLDDILNQLECGCVVVDADLAILHANETARAWFSRSGLKDGRLEFADFPQPLGSKLYEALQSEAAFPSFKYRPPESPGAVYRIRILPFKSNHAGAINAILMLVEDYTHQEQSQELAVEASNLRLLKVMAEHLAHEIGNSLMPICTYKQVTEKQASQNEMQRAVIPLFDEGIQRIFRLSHQMLYLAQESVPLFDLVPVKKCVEEAFAEARGLFPRKQNELQFNDGSQNLAFPGNFTAVKHALVEVMLNAIQANPPAAKVHVATSVTRDANEIRWLTIEVQDHGGGFTTEAAGRAFEPFYSKRDVGIGLGLTVAHKIITAHKGRIELFSKPEQQAAVVRILLPLSADARW